MEVLKEMSWTDQRRGVARSWNLKQSEIRYDTNMTAWAEKNVRYIIRRFAPELEDEYRFEFVSAPGGFRGWLRSQRRYAAVGPVGRMFVDGTKDLDGFVVAVAEDLIEREGAIGSHLVLRHEVAHMIDYYENGDTKEDGRTFKRICNKLGAPLSSNVADTSDMQNYMKSLEKNIEDPEVFEVAHDF